MMNDESKCISKKLAQTNEMIERKKFLNISIGLTVLLCCQSLLPFPLYKCGNNSFFSNIRFNKQCCNHQGQHSKLKFYMKKKVVHTYYSTEILYD